MTTSSTIETKKHILSKMSFDELKVAAERGDMDSLYAIETKKHILSKMSFDKLKGAAERGDMDSLYAVLQQDPHVLDDIDSITCIDTPLHHAAFAGRIDFATDIMILKPSFSLKLNLQGFTPMHLALQKGHKKIVIRLLDINKELVRVKGKDGVTPLHLAIEKEETTEILLEFLKACPGSIEDLTVRRETALHIAVKHQRYEALKVLTGCLEGSSLSLEKRVLNLKDEDGNTILHIAASNNDTQVISLLKKSPMDFDAKNLVGKTAFDMTTDPDVKETLVSWAATRTNNIWAIRLCGSIISMRGWLSAKLNLRERISEEVRNAYLVVATLVATATYQSALNPPGGLRQIDAVGTNNTLIHPPTNSSIYEAKSIMSNDDFITFSTMNLCAFLASTMIIVCLLPRNVASLIFALPVSILIVTYLFSVTQISPTHHAGNIVRVTFVVLFIILMMLVRVFVLD